MEKRPYSVFYQSPDGFFVCKTDFKDLDEAEGFITSVIFTRDGAKFHFILEDGKNLVKGEPKERTEKFHKDSMNFAVDILLSSLTKSQKMIAPPVFAKDHQTIRKQGAFLGRAIARRRAILEKRGITPPLSNLVINQCFATFYHKITAKVEGSLRPLFSCPIHNRFKLCFVAFKTAYILKIA